jgi:uncharacterized protein YndB with AHSA1/START domain
MQLESSVHIRRSPEHVWAYLGDVSNVAAWDRGVARSEATSSTPPGVGFEFDTFAHPRGKSADGSWGKMSYRITDIDPVRGCTIQLTSSAGNARYFKSAQWRFRVESELGGCRVHCVAVFMLRWRYLVLAPVFLAMKQAIRTDLEQLKAKLEAQSH